MISQSYTSQLDTDNMAHGANNIRVLFFFFLNTSDKPTILGTRLHSHQGVIIILRKFKYGRKTILHYTNNIYIELRTLLSSFPPCIKYNTQRTISIKYGLP